MQLNLTFAEQATGIVLNKDGSRCLNGGHVPYKADDLSDAVEQLDKFLVNHPCGEGWIRLGEVSYLVTVPTNERFTGWIGEYKLSGLIFPVSLGMNIGEVISLFGIPAKVASGFRKQPLSGVFRYEPGEIDFHFDELGLLFLVYDDDLEEAHAILERTTN